MAVAVVVAHQATALMHISLLLVQAEQVVVVMALTQLQALEIQALPIQAVVVVVAVVVDQLTT
jgi:hypothetical protein